MCMSLGTEPDPEQTPPDYSDLMDITKVSIEIYNFLADRWDQAGYQGKDYGLLPTLYVIYDIVEQEAKMVILQYVKILDKENTKRMNDKIALKMKSKKPAANVKKG